MKKNKINFSMSKYNFGVLRVDPRLRNHMPEEEGYPASAELFTR